MVVTDLQSVGFQYLMELQVRRQVDTLLEEVEEELEVDMVLVELVVLEEVEMEELRIFQLHQQQDQQILEVEVEQEDIMEVVLEQ
jgi:hypothetical protein